MSGRSVRALRTGAVIAGLAGLAALPTSVLSDLPVVCVWRRLFDLDCLGCGMTRALSSALHGDLRAAVTFNAGVTVLLPGIAAAVVHDVRALCCRDAAQNHPPRPRRCTAWLRHR